MAKAEKPKQESSSSSKSPQQGLLNPPILAHGPSSGPVHKVLAMGGNLANLLPTGTVLIFHALSAPFSNNGSCHFTNKFLTAILTSFFSLVCFLSSFTDSYVGPTGKLYYGIATRKGLCVFNVGKVDSEEEGEGREEDLSKYKIRFIDFVHATMSLLVFLVIALGDHNVTRCFFGDFVGTNSYNALLANLPLGVGALSCFFFMLFPTNRRGIGYADHLSSN